MDLERLIDLVAEDGVRELHARRVEPERKFSGKPVWDPESDRAASE
jgi:hypothetical protein